MTTAITDSPTNVMPSMSNIWKFASNASSRNWGAGGRLGTNFFNVASMCANAPPTSPRAIHTPNPRGLTK